MLLINIDDLMPCTFYALQVFSKKSKLVYAHKIVEVLQLKSYLSILTALEREFHTKLYKTIGL